MSVKILIQHTIVDLLVKLMTNKRMFCKAVDEQLGQQCLPPKQDLDSLVFSYYRQIGGLFNLSMYFI